MRKPSRIAISKRVRFEVFKRDGFICQYCGAHPPSVVLHVDHINAVARGGKNDPDNLVTACADCNLGKAAVPLSAVPQGLSEKAREVAEREEQLQGYNEILQAKRDRLEKESWEIAECLFPGSKKDGINRDYFASIKRFTDRLGYHRVLDAAEAALARTWQGRQAFLYFCGICWGEIREQTGEVKRVAK